ncbi:MAG TPA: hypothetical protein VLT33_04310 [Labilithrix sp.]|nr:hypothetical protein [Labilithrix sp.]
MKSFVFPLALGIALAGCGKDAPKKPVDEPKKATPVPSDMVFNDFVPAGGGAGIVGVKTDGGIPEGGLGPDSPAGAEPGAAPAAEDGPTKLKVTEAGAEPRAARKYAFVTGKSDRRLLTVRQSVGREGAGPAQEAAFALTADFTPRAVKPTGTKIELKVLKIDMPDAQGAQKAQAQAQLAQFAGLLGSFDISSHGEVGEVDFKADEKMAGPGAEVIIQSLQQALELVVAPFPTEPVGVGAKWERKVERKERGQETSSKHTFTLTEVSAEGGTVTAEVDLQVPKHPFQQRGVPPGATEEVKGKGTYTYAFKFDHIATKVSGDMTITRRIELSDGKGGPKQSVAEIIKLKNSLETSAGGAAPAPAPKQ